MRKQVKLGEIGGKTVEGINYEHNYNYIILFTDQTFAYIQAIFDKYDEKPELNEEFDPDDYSVEDLLQFGIIYLVEVEAEIVRRQKREEEKRQIATNRERANYERLKAKFDPPT